MNCVPRFCTVTSIAPRAAASGADRYSGRHPGAEGAFGRFLCRPFPAPCGIPCSIAPTVLNLGPFAVSATKDCPVVGTKLPLIVITHGRTGGFLGHRDTA
jgi:hypothetical protein